LNSLLVLLVGLLSIAASPPVAMRVEIEPVRAMGPDTAIELTVQIAPEDRARIGRSAWLQAELKKGKAAKFRIARAVDVNAKGITRIEVVWPPGEYTLRVDIESADGDGEGIWMGPITIPRLALEPESVPAPEPPPPAVPEEAAPAVPEEAAPAAVAAPPPAEAPEPEPVAPEPVQAAPPPAATVAADITDWGAADPATADLTVMVTDMARPVLALDSGQFRVKLDGSESTIEEFGDAEEVPLFLGIAVDVSHTMAPYLPSLSRQLSRLSLRTVGERGGLFLVTADADAELTLGWGATPSAVAQTLARTGSSEQGDLVGLVTTSLEAFEGRRGRKFLIVITDGGHMATKADWKEAVTAADGAAVPIHVVGFRGDWLKERTRRNLERMSVGSGGKSYFIPDTGMLDMTLDYLTELIKGSYALRVRRQTGAKATKVRVETTNRNFQVFYPRSLR
jgi:hypothetical protein